jgi:hypothetical protein
MCLHALACAAFFSRAARNGRTRPPAPPPDSAFQPLRERMPLGYRGGLWAARRGVACGSGQWGTESGRLLPGRGDTPSPRSPAVVRNPSRWMRLRQLAREAPWNMMEGSGSSAAPPLHTMHARPPAAALHRYPPSSPIAILCFCAK